MPSSYRKLAGTLGMLVFLILYVLGAMAVAIVLQVNASRFGELVFYALAGTLWVPIACWIVSWMHRSDPQQTE